MRVYDTIVIGAGQSGLAMGYQLQHAGLDFVILEANSHIGGSWNGYYNSLKLFTPARYSSLPGLSFPGDPEHYPSKVEVIAYLSNYATHFRLPIKTETCVKKVEKNEKVFIVITNKDETYASLSLIIASGPFNKPFIPNIPGQEIFQRQILHAIDYQKPEPFQEQQVIIVGAGNSAAQIGIELTKVAHVTIASKRAIRFVPQRVAGKDMVFWTRHLGIDYLPIKEGGVVIDTGNMHKAIMQGNPERKPMFTHFTKTGITWQDGKSEDVDTVIFCTGFLPNLDFLSSLNALDARGRARYKKGISLTTQGLYYVGIQTQRAFNSATLRGVGPDSAYMLPHIAAYIRKNKKDSASTI